MSNRLIMLAADIRAAHADICGAHKYSAERSIDAGKWLDEAKKSQDMPRGGWKRWVEDEAGVPLRTADRYVALARAIAEGLVTWPVIAEEGQKAALEAAWQEAKRREHEELDQPASDTCTVADLGALIASGRQFGCIYADPPWLYDNQGTRAAAGNHYDGLTVDAICAMPVADLALPDAHLHLWTTNGFLFDARRVIEAWGFEFRSSFVWVKSSIGIGNYWRNSHEFLLTGIRGNAKRFSDHSLRSWIECDRGDHSAKPEQVRAMLERASPPPYLELFGRIQAERWTVWGDEVERSLLFPEAAE